MNISGECQIYTQKVCIIDFIILNIQYFFFAFNILHNILYCLSILLFFFLFCPDSLLTNLRSLFDPHLLSPCEGGFNSPMVAWQRHTERLRPGGGVSSQDSRSNSKDDKTTPFITTPHSHPAFIPQKVGKGYTNVSG